MGQGGNRVGESGSAGREVKKVSSLGCGCWRSSRFEEARRPTGREGPQASVTKLTALPTLSMAEACSLPDQVEPGPDELALQPARKPEQYGSFPKPRHPRPGRIGFGRAARRAGAQRASPPTTVSRRMRCCIRICSTLSQREATAVLSRRSVNSTSGRSKHAAKATIACVPEDRT